MLILSRCLKQLKKHSSIGSNRSGGSVLKARIDYFPYKLLMPVLLMELLFVLLPLIYGIYYSAHKVEYFVIGDFVGLDNFKYILSSSAVGKSLLVTAIFAAFSLVFTMAVGFALALSLNRDTKPNVFMRSIVLIPYVISMMVGSMLIKWLISPDSGIISILLAPFGIGQFSLLTSPTGAMAALVANAVWRDAAFAMILLMAGLKSIPGQLYSAAKIDGASTWYSFKRITLPLMRNVINITIIRLTMHFINVLTIPFVLTGGAPNDATKTISLQLFNLGFQSYKFGQANALAVLILLFNLIIISFMLRSNIHHRRGGV